MNGNQTGDERTLNGCRTDIERERNGNGWSVERAVYGKFFLTCTVHVHVHMHREMLPCTEGVHVQSCLRVSLLAFALSL